jgi:hypothetical protein
LGEVKTEVEIGGVKLGALFYGGARLGTLGSAPNSGRKGADFCWKRPTAVYYALIRACGGGGGGGGIAIRGGAAAPIGTLLVGPLTADVYLVHLGDGGRAGENGSPTTFEGDDLPRIEFHGGTTSPVPIIRVSGGFPAPSSDFENWQFEHYPPTNFTGSPDGKNDTGIAIHMAGQGGLGRGGDANNRGPGGAGGPCAGGGSGSPGGEGGAGQLLLLPQLSAGEVLNLHEELLRRLEKVQATTTPSSVPK